MAGRITLPLTDIPDGASLRRACGDHEVALFRRGEQVFAVAADCPHRGGPLDEADLDPDTLLITCPWHGWVFSLESGKSPSHPGEVACFRVTREGDDVVVDAP